MSIVLNDELIVRPRTEADFAGLAKVMTEVHAVTGYPLEGLPDAKAFICDEQGPLEGAWVAECEGRIVGHIAINKAVQGCPAADTWRERYGKEDRIAVVGRLFVHPVKTGKARGVTRALHDAVVQWSREHATRLIFYCVAWNATRRMIAESLTARYGWIHYGDSFYTSPMNGVRYDAPCYAQAIEGDMQLDLTPRVRSKQSGGLFGGFVPNGMSLLLLWSVAGMWIRVTYLRCHTHISRMMSWT